MARVRAVTAVGIAVVVCIVIVAIGCAVYFLQPAGTDPKREDMFAPADDVSEDMYKVPNGFFIGSASAAYQVEGAWNASRKSPSVQDVFYHSRPSDDNGDIAEDSYHQWREDVKLLKTLGMQTYRFSLSWPRLLPGGSQANGQDDVGVQYYHDLIDKLLEEGIQPLVTLHHWDIPQIYQNDGGWLIPEIQDRFSDYADFVFNTYGSKVKTWIIMNEPHNFCLNAYEAGILGPGMVLPGTGGYLCVHNMILAHAKAYRLYDEKYRAAQKGSIGSALDMPWSEPASNSKDDDEAAERTRVFTYAWFADPLMTGDYPELMRTVVDANSKAEGRAKSRLPTFTAEERALINGTLDFLGLNHYTTSMVSNIPEKPTASSYSNDVHVNSNTKDSWVFAALDPVCPWGLRYTLNWIKDRYNNFPVLITENGCMAYPSEGVNDPQRVGYHSTYMRAVMRAINEDHCNVIGYTIWSLLESLEWGLGYKYTYGLVHIDRTKNDRPRTLKNSAAFFQEVMRTRRIPYHEPISS